MIELHTVVILFLDKLVECMLHALKLFFRQVAFKDTKLDAITEIFQHFMNTISLFIVMNIIRDDQIHVCLLCEEIIFL